MPERLAVIVGSGFDDRMAACPYTPPADNDFGVPSSPLYELDFGGRPVTVIARHGVPHAIPPHRINYRANLMSLAQSGTTAIVALNTVGAITGRVGAGGLAVPDQIIDYTWGRAHTFADTLDGANDHIEFTQPFSDSLRQALLTAAAAADIACLDGGVYAATQGPRLETAAEIDRLERDGADYVGMTGMPEAALAAELGIAYACLALVVNRAAGRGEQPIHSELQAVSGAARSNAIAVVEQFFREHGGDTS